MRLVSWKIIAFLVAAMAPAMTCAQGYYPSVRVPRKPAPMRRSAVSPYLNLIQYDELGDQSIPVYQTLVRPFVEQRRLNQFQASQVFQLQQQVAYNAARTRQGESLRGTGHETSYQNHSHFFPTVGGQR